MLAEFKTQDTLLHHEISNYQSLQYLIHSHTTYEFFYFVSGDVMYYYRGQQIMMKPHTLLFIHPVAEHGCKILSSASYERYTFHFEPSMLSGSNNQQLLSMVDEQSDRDLPLYELSPETGIHTLMDQFLQCTWLSQKQKAEQVPKLIGAILFHLLLQKPISREMIDRARQHPAIERSNRVDEVVYWINSHLTTPMTVDQLAKQFFISKNTLNRHFQSTMGLSVREYIRSQRIDLARRLIEEGYPATVAATNAGFRDYSTFYRANKAIDSHPLKGKKDG